MSGTEALGDGGRRPHSGNTGVTVGGGWESSSPESFLYIPDLPVDIPEQEERDVNTIS